MKPHLFYLLSFFCIFSGCQKDNEIFNLLSARGLSSVNNAEDFSKNANRSILEPGTWTLTNPLMIARSRHTASLLPDGKILIAGGYTGQLNNPISTNTAELFNPITNTWSMTDTMSFPRANHIAIRLANGKILVAGGRANNVATATAELFDASTGSWSVTGQLNHSRFFHTATLLDNGNVLVTGGLSGDGFSIGKTAEVYDPVSGSWTLVDHMAIMRWGHSATLLENGTVLVAGGSGPAGDGVYTPRSEIYDPLENEWRNAGNLNTPRGFHAAVKLENGNVLVAGGLPTATSQNKITVTAEIFNPETGKWTYTGNLTFDRIPGPYGAVLLQDGHILVAGGRTATTESYAADNGVWTTLFNMNISRSFHTLTYLPDGTVLAVGGENRNGLTASVELYNTAGMEAE